MYYTYDGNAISEHNLRVIPNATLSHVMTAYKINQKLSVFISGKLITISHLFSLKNRKFQNQVLIGKKSII